MSEKTPLQALKNIENVLIHLIKEKNTASLKRILDSDVDVNASYIYSEKPLIEAIKVDSIEIVEMLLKSNADVDTRTKQGNTALMAATKLKHKKIVEALLKKKANVNLIKPFYDAEDYDIHADYTALMYACKNNDIEIAKLLIDYDANLDCKVELEGTPLIWASYNNNLEMAQLLIESGADINAKADSFIGGIYSTNRTALFVASKGKSKEVAKLLIDRGADVNAKDGEGSTALMRASRYDSKAVASLLLEANADVNAKNEDGETTLIRAAILNNKEMIAILIEKQGIDTEIKIDISKLGDKTLQVTGKFRAIDLAYDEAEIKIALIKIGSTHKELSQEDKKHIDTLKKYFEKRREDTIKTELKKLLKKPCDEFKKLAKNLLSTNIDLCLSESIKAERLDIVELCLKKGADVEKNDKAWEYASVAKDSEKVLALLKNQKTLMKPTYDPKQLVKLLKNFTRDTPIKYTTHHWDFGDIDKEHGGFDGFMNKVQKHWDSSIKDDIKNLSSNLHEKIEEFLTLWRATDGLKEWCESGKDPFDFEDFGKKIDTFKQRIEIRTENHTLEEMFLKIEESFTHHEIECRKLKGKKFYTDAAQLKLTLKKIFSEIEKRDKHTKIVVEATDTTGKYIELCITHIGSFSHKSAEELLKEIDDGDFADIKKSLQNLCDWSVEDNKHRINYLVSDNSIEEIEELDEKVKGFRHLFRFYR